MTACASWSAQDVGRRSHRFPASRAWISSALLPFRIFEIARRFPGQPFVNEMLVMIPFSSLSNLISVEQLPFVL